MTPQLPLLETEKRFHYVYDEPVNSIVTRLRILSAPDGGHRVLEQELTVSPAPAKTLSTRDRFSNEVIEFHHERVDSSLEFSLRQLTECCVPSQPSLGQGQDGLPDDLAHSLNKNSFLVDACEETSAVAGESAAILSEKQRFLHLGRWVYQTMRFQAGVTGVRTPASEALRGRAGVCQDFSHILLSLCCSAGIPARYVSGFVPGEGHMHAWVQALVSEQSDGDRVWWGFDPTHNRATDYRYLRVAVGRDYSDVSPITGTFCGSRPGKLTGWASHRVRVG